MTRFPALAALLAPLALAACRGTSEPPADPGPGRLIFTRVNNGLQDLYTMDLNGKNLQQVTTSYALDDWGSWSRDTLRIVFMSNRIPDTTHAVHYHIFTMNSDGSNVAQLTFEDSADSYNPAWSPDGTKIIFASTRDGNREIYVMDPNGANTIRLTNNPAADEQPAWSPDGSKIAFVSDRDGNTEIYVMNPDGTGQVNITNDPGTDVLPAWSPDGKKIAFQSNRQTDFAIWIMNADGSNAVRLTDPGVPNGAPSWSPDGTRIAYEQGGHLWVMSADGSRKIQITNGVSSDGLPRWRPIL